LGSAKEEVFPQDSVKKDMGGHGQLLLLGLGPVNKVSEPGEEMTSQWNNESDVIELSNQRIDAFIRDDTMSP
jgi:hypothetical protein